MSVIEAKDEPYCLSSDNIRIGSAEYAELATNLPTNGVINFRQGHVEMACLKSDPLAIITNLVGVDPLNNNRLVLVAGGGGTGGGDVSTTTNNTYADGIVNNFNGEVSFTAGTTTLQPATVNVMNATDLILSVDTTGKLVKNTAIPYATVPQLTSVSSHADANSSAIATLNTTVGLKVSGTTDPLTSAQTISTGLTLSGALTLPLSTAPASATATGTVGEFRMSYDGQNTRLYFCVETDKWREVALNSF